MPKGMDEEEDEQGGEGDVGQSGEVVDAKDHASEYIPLSQAEQDGDAEQQGCELVVVEDDAAEVLCQQHEGNAQIDYPAADVGSQYLAGGGGEQGCVEGIKQTEAVHAHPAEEEVPQSAYGYGVVVEEYGLYAFGMAVCLLVG